MTANTSNSVLTGILDGLMRRYRQRVADVGRVTQLLLDRQLIGSIEDIENDHIAFRTLGVEHLGIQSLEQIFLNCGYHRRDPFVFKTKKLDAFWYSPPADHLPRIFISELRVSDLSPEAQAIITSYTNTVTSDPVSELDLNDVAAVDKFLHSPLWPLPTWADYQRLLDESEYAAWVIYNRYYLNHFTISVHNLPPPYNTVENFNGLLEEHGIQLNDSGGKIKTSPDGLLIQSSSVAQVIPAEFDCGNGKFETKSIAGSYVEFAQRGVLPEFQNLAPEQVKREHRRDGFEAGNADKIFESTFSTQTQRDAN